MTGPTARWSGLSMLRHLLRSKFGWSDQFVVMHSGNVGLSQSLESLVDAAECLREHEGIMFAIVGDGAAKTELQRRARRVDCPTSSSCPTRTREASRRRSALPTSTSSACAEDSPDSSSRARSTDPRCREAFIAAVEAGAEPALIASEFGCGIVVEPDNAEALADAILRMRGGPLEEMGRRGRAAFEERFDRPVATEAYRQLLERLAGR